MKYGLIVIVGLILIMTLGAVRFIGDSQQGVYDEDTGKWIKAEVFA